MARLIALLKTLGLAPSVRPLRMANPPDPNAPDGPQRPLGGANTSAPVEKLVEPMVGRIMGLRWGADEAALLRAWPEVAQQRDDGDVRTWSITQSLEPPGVLVTVAFTFGFEGLFAVDLRVPGDTAERRLAWAALYSEVSGCFTVARTSPDVSYHVLEEGTTRLVGDALDAHIRLEELLS